MKNKLILVGYMGSGKSLIGQKLSQKLNLKFIDLDKSIETEMNLSINEIFEIKGELFFRKLEHDILIDLIDSDQEFVLSTGGGAPCYYNNHLLLKRPEINSIYLNASVEILTHRLKFAKAKRPIIANKTDDELTEFIAKHLFERSFYYQHAKLIINDLNKSPVEIVDEIVSKLNP